MSLSIHSSSFLLHVNCTVLFSVQYAFHVYNNLRKWCKNPRWSVSCCLTLLLPLTELPGEMNDLVGKNARDNQIQPGEIEMPTLFGVVKDSGAIDISLEEGEHENESGTEMTKENDRKCHRGTQTKLSTIHSIGNSTAISGGDIVEETYF